MYCNEMGSDGMIYIPSFMIIRLGIQVALTLLPHLLVDYNVRIINGRAY